MKIAPVSGDMAVKLAVGLVAFAGVAYLVFKARQTADAAAQMLSTTFNPASPDNVIYQTVNTAFASDTGPGANADGSWTLGGWIYDVTHPGQVQAIANLTGR
jgi:hypothetical protein